MSNLTVQDVYTVGASYWLRQRQDKTGPNISAICDDTGLSREIVKRCIEDLKTNHPEWLAEYKETVEAEARKELASEAVTRIRNEFYRMGYEFLRQTRRPLLALHKHCLEAATSNKQLDEAEFQALKIKQYERTASLRALDKILKIVEGLESAVNPKAAPVFNNQNFQLSPEEKKTRFLRLEALEPLPEKHANNGS